MDAAVWVAIIGAVGSVLTVVATKWTPSKRARGWLVLASIALLILAAVSLTAWIVLRPAPEATLMIGTPEDGSLIGKQITVSGTSSNLDDQDRVMLVVYWPEGGRYYPVAEPVEFATGTGDWRIRAQVGQDGGQGVTFDLILVLNDSEAHQELESYLEQAKGASSYDGLVELPQGTQRFDTVTVTRTD